MRHLIPYLLFKVQENDVAQMLPLHIVCAMFRDQGRVTDLENLLMGSYGIRREDRKLIFMWTLQAYADQVRSSGLNPSLCSKL